MPKITFLPQNITVEAKNGSPLLETAKFAGVSFETPCGAKGVCRKCLIKIVSGKVESKSGSFKNIRENLALICQTNILSEDVTVEIISGLYGEDGKFDDASCINKIDFKINPSVKQIDLKVSPPMPLDGMSDLDRFEKALKTKKSFESMKIPLGVLQKLPLILRKFELLKAVYYMDGNILNIIDLTGAEKTGLYGVAADIGTTTATIRLADLNTGEIKSQKTEYNAQIECGSDVITRINYAKKHLEELKERILKTVNELINFAISENNIDKNQLYCAFISGNTVMTHLLLGICPEYIRLDPYTPAVFEVPVFSAEKLGIIINPNAPVKFSPAVGSYVGGDITAGVLCTPLCEEKNGIVLFLDIGTNGEILLGNDEFILGCACSAGPAFEGGGIECGMRASKGAIDDFKIAENGDITIKTVGGGPPSGICGSGIIAVAGEMFKNGWIDAAGRFTEKIPGKIKKTAKPNKIYIYEGISISESDIENLIRAKGAVFSACRTLLKNMGLSFDDIEKFYIAGGFGKFLNIENAVTIGLLPGIAKEKTIYLGNTSVEGSYKSLLSEENEKIIKKTAERITYIDLSNETGYMEEYFAALFIPHTDADLFK